MKNIVVRLAKGNDALVIKNLINKMYRNEYETRKIQDIAREIDNRNEIYSIAECDENIIGFCGATKIKDDNSRASLDYIYINQDSRNLITAYNCLMLVVNELIDDNIQSAIMIVQTFNKQRFLHYALSDKHIIFESERKHNGNWFKDQTLLIDDLHKISKLSFNDLIKKVHLFRKENE